jgi:hypothetical protein
MQSGGHRSGARDAVAGEDPSRAFVSFSFLEEISAIHFSFRKKYVS